MLKQESKLSKQLAEERMEEISSIDKKRQKITVLRMSNDKLTCTVYVFTWSAMTPSVYFYFWIYLWKVVQLIR